MCADPHPCTYSHAHRCVCTPNMHTSGIKAPQATGAGGLMEDKGVGGRGSGWLWCQRSRRRCRASPRRLYVCFWNNK
eukprot:jgi/Botrbrau1/23174/Bobra.0041s0025.1